MTPTILSIAALALATALVWWRVRRRQKRDADRALSWTEWERPRVWEIDVEVRPLVREGEE